MKRALMALAAFGFLATAALAEDAKIVLVAGKPSHAAGEHEFNAGTKLLVKWLEKVPGVKPVFVEGGWPSDESVFDGAKALVFYMDGGSRHPMIQGDHLKTLKKLMDRGVGLVCLHYAVEVPKGEPGDAFLDWIGGYYETGYSLNPHNDAKVLPAKDHPITRGVAPFESNDEWYFKIRFRPNDPRLVPILTTNDRLKGRDGKTFEGPQTFAWAVERADGGRGFGFTGAHFHRNWGQPAFRKLVLNAILWSAKLDIPADGVASEITPDELKQNLDPKTR